MIGRRDHAPARETCASVGFLLWDRSHEPELMRKAGYREFAVAAVSSALFAVLHLGNLLTGQDLLATLPPALQVRACRWRCAPCAACGWCSGHHLLVQHARPDNGSAPHA